MWDILRLPFRARPCESLPWGIMWGNIKDEHYYIYLQTYLCLLDSLLENIWIWSGLGSGTWNCLASWHGYGSTCWSYIWILDRQVSWIVTCQFLCHAVRIFGCILTFHNGWLENCYCRRIYDCLVTRNYTCIPTWISKSWIWVIWHAVGGTSWVVVSLWSDQVSLLLMPPH